VLLSQCGRQRLGEEGDSADRHAGIMRPGGFALTDRALQLCSFKAGDRVADIGCGLGATVEHLRRSHGLDAMGIDPAVVSLEQDVRRTHSLPLCHGLAEELPFGTGTLDGILAECSLSVIANKQQAVAEFCRVLRPGGKLAITDVYARNASGLDSIRGTRLPFGMSGIMTQDTLTAMVEQQGFSPLHWEDHSHTLKEYLVQAIMRDDPLEFGRSCGGEGNDSWQECIAGLKRVALGYFLLVASNAA
jgi:arsenite methyltransferase